MVYILFNLYYFKHFTLVKQQQYTSQKITKPAKI